MILTCPACATQYRLKDGAIPPEGRQVRCAACKHKWHQDGDADAADARSNDAGAWAGSAPAAVPDEQQLGIAPPQPDPRDAEPPLAEAPTVVVEEQMIAQEPRPEVPAIHPEFDRAAPAEFAAGPPQEQYGGEQTEDYGFAAIPAMHDEDEPRRGGRLGWLIGIVLLVVAAAAAFYFLAPPELKARAGIAEAGESQLELMLTTSDRQRLASGNELLAISGRVINSTDREQAVPPIHAELRDPASNRLVYQWTIAPPARSLAPGESRPFNSAEVDVPKGGESLSLRFAS